MQKVLPSNTSTRATERLLYPDPTAQEHQAKELPPRTKKPTVGIIQGLQQHSGPANFTALLQKTNTG